jgi:hypothetical protein
VVATILGQTDAAVRDAARLGGDIRYRDDEAGYIRVRIPIDDAVEFSETAGIEAVAVDSDDSYPRRLDAADGLLQAPQWPPVPGDYPLTHAYSPLQSLAADSFMRNTTFDGRGVTIGVRDGNIDP